MTATNVWGGWAQRLTSWYGSLPSRSPVPLALLRIAVGVLVLLSPEPNQTRQLIAGPDALLVAPNGLEFLPPLLKALAPVLPYVHMTMNVAALAAIMGVFTRTSLCLTAVGFILLFGGAQLSGSVTHDMHLLWLLVVLIVSDSHRALSIDAWRRKGPIWFVHPSRNATICVAIARLLLGLVYLFPGISKLRESGLQWALSDNLINQMHLKWFINDGLVPWPRVDLYPGVVKAGGLLVLLFELGFIALIWTQRGRVVAAVSGLGFHFTTAHFLYIHFPSLWGCYVILWNGPTSPHRPVPNVADTRRSLFACGVGLALVVAVTVPGLRRDTQTWPFACYPDFAHIVPSVAWDLAADATFSDGSTTTLRPARRRPQSEWGTVWRILGLYDGLPRAAALDAYGQRLISTTFRTQKARLQSVRYFAEEYSTDPDQNTAGPRRRRLVYRGH